MLIAFYDSDEQGLLFENNFDYMTRGDRVAPIGQVKGEPGLADRQDGSQNCMRLRDQKLVRKQQRVLNAGNQVETTSLFGAAMGDQCDDFFRHEGLIQRQGDAYRCHDPAIHVSGIPSPDWNVSFSFRG